MRHRYYGARLCISHLEMHEFNSADQFSVWGSIYASTFTSNDLEPAFCSHLYTFPFGAVNVRELSIRRGSFVSRMSCKKLQPRRLTPTPVAPLTTSDLIGLSVQKRTSTIAAVMAS